MVEYSICKMECFSQYTPRRQSWSECWKSWGKSFPQGDELVLLLTILLTWSSWSLSPKWPLSSSDVSTFLASPISQNLRNIYIFVIQSVAFTAVIIPSNLSYSHKYGAYSYLLLFITQNIWYKFLSSFIFSPNVVKKREGVLLDENWLLLLNGGEMV